MIARAPKPHRNLILSDRLGLVSVPLDTDPGVPMEPAFPPLSARDKVLELGRILGLATLPPGEETFPESESRELPEGKADWDPAVWQTLQSLDAVWLEQGEVVAAFVMVPCLGAWEGLRRLADLLALHPKLKAPLYAVTQPACEAGILSEIHRPAYRLLKRPLADQLRLLDWDRLRTELEQLGERVRYLKPEFLEGISDRIAPPAEG